MGEFGRAHVRIYENLCSRVRVTRLYSYGKQLYITDARSFVTDMKLIYYLIYVIFRNFQHNYIGFVTDMMVSIAVEACNPNPGA